jgi:hypothetical protein
MSFDTVIRPKKTTVRFGFTAFQAKPTGFHFVPPEDMPPLTSLEKQRLSTMLEEAEADGEINLSEFCE